MRERDALRAAQQFVRERYPEHVGDHVEVCIDGGLDERRRKSWSFGVRVDEEDSRHDPDARNDYVGYVHADGSVEGLY